MHTDTAAHLANPYRLPRHIVPTRYDLELSPDLAAATFTGEAVITLNVLEAGNVIVLNANELGINSVRVNGELATHELHPDTERLVVTTANTLNPGTAMLSISFTGTLNDKLRGFYRSTYVDDAGVEQVIATTQMQSTDCRRAFPCWDEPDFKAVFGVTLVVNNDLMAISNGPEVSRTPSTTNPHKVAVRFADTMPMSTYIVAFIVGRLEATAPVDVNGTPMRLVHVPGKAHLTEFGLRIGAFSLKWFEDYYGIKYPGEKVDLVALPDFAAGAMENLGCITFREVLLLVDPEKATQMEQQLVADVVSHENAHMWFGDLVTMKWWNGIWLNEAFATFMEVAACDAFAPQWKRWTAFGLDRSAAFDVDSLHSTRPVEFPVDSPDDCEGMFDVLTYEKGGSILRMLEMFLGQDRFRDGVRHYLTKHSYKNTETNDLWDAIEEAVNSDGRGSVPVRALMDSWIWQPGYPLVGADIEDGALVLRQNRFSFDENTDPTVWLVPIHLRNGNNETKVLLDQPAARIPLADPNAPVVVNAGGHGYFRVAYSPALLARLNATTIAGMSTIERYNLVDDAWNAVVAGRLSTVDFLAFLNGFANERELAVWQAIAIGLRGCERLLPGHQQHLLQRRIANLVAPALADLGWQPKPGEDDLTGKLRGLLIVLLACDAGDPDAQQTARTFYAAAEAGQDVHPEVVAAATSVVASTGGEAEFNRFVDKFKTAESPQDQMRALYALADFQSADLIERACQFAFSGEVKTQNAPFLLNRCIANREFGPVAWRVVRQRWTEANEKFPVNTIVRMIDTTKLLNSPEQLADVQAFFAEHPIPQSVKTLEQVMERQRVNAALRVREGEPLVAHLQA